MAKYKKKPVEIEAFQYDGDLKNSDGKYYVPIWAIKAFEEEALYYSSLKENEPPCELFIKTSKGNHHVSVGDYIIQGIEEELHVYKSNIFTQTYENVANPMTNYDRIKAMSIEKIATNMINSCPANLDTSLYTGISGKYTKTAEETIKNNKKWLKQEVTQ